MVHLNKITIEEANESDCIDLTSISFAAKRHWNYPETYYDLWKNELTITADYIRINLVFKAILQDQILGFYSIVENKADFWSGEVFVKKGFWLEHIFIKPEFHKLGIGALLIEHAKHISKDKEISSLMIFVDPNAKGFYDKVGANYLYDSKSSVPGRMIPVYNLEV